MKDTSMGLTVYHMVLACVLMNIILRTVLVGEGSEFPRMTRKEKKAAKRAKKEAKKAAREEKGN